MKKIKLTLTDNASLEGYEGAFYRFACDDGKKSAKGIQNNWYSAPATDEDGNEYKIVWEISKPELFAIGDEDCCDWDNPAEVVNLSTGKPVENYEIIW